MLVFDESPQKVSEKVPAYLLLEIIRRCRRIITRSHRCPPPNFNASAHSKVVSGDEEHPQIAQKNCHYSGICQG